MAALHPISRGIVLERIHPLQAKKSQLADSLLSDAARAAGTVEVSDGNDARRFDRPLPKLAR